MSLDRIDRAILRVLQHDARCSNKTLAAQVGLAPSSCLERVRRLWASGVLRRATVDIDPRAVGIGLRAMVSVRLRHHGRDNFRSFTDHLHTLPEVVSVYQLSGADDYLVEVAVRDSDHLRDLTWTSLTAHDAVGHIETALIFEQSRKPSLPDFTTDAAP